MTDRIRTIVVQLDQPVRDDDVEPILDLIRCVRHVAAVSGDPSSPEAVEARAAAAELARWN